MRNVLTALVLLAACGPTGQTPPGGAQPAAGVVSNRPVIVGVTAEPSVIGSKFGGGGSGAVDFPFIFHAQLTQFAPSGLPIPILVEEAPTLNSPTWRVSDDGRMETTYRLRPGLTWHDGAPFTADDVLFTWQAILTPALPAIDRMPEKHIEAIDAPDAQTVVVHWGQSYIYANTWDLQPIPRHILGGLVGDPHAFASASYWTADWVGLGPYRLAAWVQGSEVRGEAFAGFAMGAPQITSVVIKIFPDANQAVAQMLAGTLDATLAGLFRPDEGVIVDEKLGPTGEANLITIPTKMRHGVFQFRDPTAPWVRDGRVRQGLMRALDRQGLADTLMRGYSRISDMYIAPADPLFPVADRTVQKYPYDRSRALDLLAQAGWTRASDGNLQGSSGERLDLEVRTTPDTQVIREAQLLADMWKQIGVASTVFVIPRVEQRNQEYRAKFPGMTTTSIASLEALYYTTDTIPHDSNRWQGTNRGGYSSLAGDRLEQQYFSALDPQRRQAVLMDILKLVSEDLPYLAFYYNVDTHSIRGGLVGLSGRYDRQPGMAYNVYTWRWEPTR